MAAELPAWMHPPTMDEALASVGMICHFIASDAAMTETFRAWIEHHPGDLTCEEVVVYLGLVHDLLSPGCEPVTFDFRPERRHAAGGVTVTETAGGHS